MNVQNQIKSYFASLPAPKAHDMQTLHDLIVQRMPSVQLWFLDGKNAENKVVSNPNVGYGHQIMHYADGKTRDFYKVGISANTSGISVYIMSIQDKTFLKETYAKDLGKASVTGYCIKFKALKDINLEVLTEAIRYGLETDSDQ